MGLKVLIKETTYNTLHAYMSIGHPVKSSQPLDFEYTTKVIPISSRLPICPYFTITQQFNLPIRCVMNTFVSWFDTAS